MYCWTLIHFIVYEYISIFCALHFQEFYFLFDVRILTRKTFFCVYKTENIVNLVRKLPSYMGSQCPFLKIL